MTARKRARAAGDGEVRVRRRRGEPRRLLLESARKVFGRRGYSGASTREIADAAGVSETLIFRNFANKAGLFRMAVVQPFIEAIDRRLAEDSSDVTNIHTSWAATRAFVESIFDVFSEHRPLAAMVFAADALVASEISELEMIAEVRDAIDRFVTFAAEAADAAGVALDPTTHALAIRGHMAMVAGLATFGPWYLGDQARNRDEIIDELTRWILLRYSPDVASILDRLESSDA